MSNHGFFRCAWRPFWFFASCDFRSNFLKVYPGYFHSHMTPVHECKVKLSSSFIVYEVLWRAWSTRHNIEYLRVSGKETWRPEWGSKPRSLIFQAGSFNHCTRTYYRWIVLGFEGEKNMPKLNFSGNLPNTIRNNILKLPVIPAGAFSNIQDGVQDCRQNVNTTI